MKEYDNEKAIISLTSWIGRIDTCYITINSLLKNCPNFHIVLCLSEEEFPNKEKDLPNKLCSLINSDKIELLWVYKNYKSFKKVFFTMDKYKDVPVISADDGCYYNVNFAEPLYQDWLLDKNKIICNVIKRGAQTGAAGGAGVIYPPNCFGDIAIKILNKEYDLLMTNPHDDRFIACLAYGLNIEFKKATPFIDDTRHIFTNLPDDKFAMSTNKMYIAGSNWKFNEIIKKYI